MHFYDLLRALVTNTLLVALLFTLARPKYRSWTLWTALAAIVTLDLGLNVFFYFRNDYTSLATLDIVFFILVSLAVKPLFREKLIRWLFNCFTAMNLYAIVVVLSYYLCGLFPHPYYAITALRALLFLAAILLFRCRLRPLYRQAAEHWRAYLLVSVGLFANFAWYFVASQDVEQMLMERCVPLLLLTSLSILIYLTIFLSLRKTLREATLREENLRIQADRTLMRVRLTLMDEALHQMSISQHDHRHLNNTLLALLQQGESAQAAALLRQQNAALPQSPQSYCQNLSVNAAVSYYVERARQQKIRCDVRLDIPDELAPTIDPLSLSMSICNLMENAITALSQLPLERRELRFTAAYTGQLLLEISNPYEGEVCFDTNGLPVTLRADHGRGSQSVADFVARCGGTLSYAAKNGIFTVRMML